MAIIFSNITKSFSTKTVLRDVSFEIPTGEIHFVLGRSGMGKSVILKHIVGLLKPDRGQITIEDEDITHLDEYQLKSVRKKCGMVFQHPALLDSLTIFDNISFGIRHETKEQIKERVHQCLKLVHLDESILFKKPNEISYGMQKRVGLARTIAPTPQYLLFDEPTTGLDPITTTAINELIQELSRELKVTSLVVSHDMGCALSIADKILVLNEAQIVAHESVARIKENSHPLIRDFLLEAL